MQIRAGYHLELDCTEITPMVLMLSVHPSEHERLVTRDMIHSSPPTIVRPFLDSYGNICHRLTAQPGRLSLRADFIVENEGSPDPVPHGARQHPVNELPDEVLQFLLGSRYCETERLMPLAWQLFGQLPAGLARVQAVADYVHGRILFGYQHARNTRTAFEAHEEGVGVCRDFAHLAVTLCRCLNIPARYVNGYLGDIGVPAVPDPMDFSAWFQVWLGDRWWTFDARHNKPRIGRILIAVGRDAADVAMITSFGQHSIARFDVITEEVSGEGLIARSA